MSVARQTGFTLVEVLLTIGLVSAMFAVSLVGLSRPQTTASLNGMADMLVADLKSQQLLAMAGNQGGSDSAQSHGIVITPQNYTLFAGETYDSQDSNNYTVASDQGVTLTTTFNNATIQFAQASGEVQDFDPNNNTITLQKNDDSRTINVNRFGTVEVN